MDQAPDDERRLNLPAVQPVTLGDSSSSSHSGRYYVPPQPSHQSQSKGLTKRPSTATLGQSSDVLLPATRPTPSFGSDETLIGGSFQDMRAGESNGREMRGGTTTHAPDESLRESCGEPSGSSPNAMEPSRNAHPNANAENYDWTSFVHAYAAGKWDPRLTPNPPQRTETFTLIDSEPAENRVRFPQFTRMVSSTSAGTAVPRKHISGTSSSSSLTSKLSLGTPEGGSDRSAGSGSTALSSLTSAHSTSAPASSVSHLPPATWQAMSLKMRRQQAQHREGDLSASAPLPEPMPQLTLPTPSRSFLSRSMSDTSATLSPAIIEEPRPNSEQSHDLNAAAAAMRLAGDGINVRPLSLPSPEVELTDPFRGHTASILPWQRDTQEHNAHSSSVNLPDEGGQGRKSRLNSFWEGLGDVFENSASGGSLNSGKSPQQKRVADFNSCLSSLPTISASPLVTPDEASFPMPRPALLPASAPLPQTTGRVPEDDYFGVVQADTTPSITFREPHGRPLSGSLSGGSRAHYPPVFEASPSSSRSQYESGRPPLDRTVSEPAGIYRTTPPDPYALDNISDLDSTSTRPHSDSYRPLHRRVREEAEFLQRGYLIPPMPPNEWERQKALYKFNIVHTSKDANFDRITLLAKLVFNAKICLISLIDSDEQWFKSEFGLGRETCSRDDSLCAHAILQNNSEPLVILDAHQDWRFAKNPMVVKHPFIRFYAGAPLRTSEGYNIGSLCIIDCESRTEFGPRQRHTLKEFAAICMRELELWRDKIQLRIRDRIQNSMEQFTRECLEIDTQTQKGDPRQLLSSTSMEKIYDRAAKLVKRTLDVEGAVLIDVSSFEEFEMPNSELSVLLYYSDPKQVPQSKPLTPAGFAQMAQFFKDFPDGKVSEAVLPACIRGLLPSNIHYALTVPILNIDKRPFAMLCAYNSNAKSKPYLEGHELSYLRAIGVIILSAVLKRRMILADKSKSLFISNISHELRTPLHGILAAAELLSGTDLTPNQASFLSTVQACGTSLVETVNHVLDFTKLSGNTKAGGSETVIRPARVDLAQLVEEATEGCWIGHRARHSSEIGSVYSPRADGDAAAQNIRLRSNVEIGIDIGYRPQAWNVICEKGGIRRCLMNLLGNALKFTTDGYVHVTLRELPGAFQTRDNFIKLELGVLDSGKGMSEDFVKNQLFQPFSQENPLQPGTGLGLAIVNSIVRSESVNGKIDVSSTEYAGTEIRIIFEAQTEPSEVKEPDELGSDWNKLGFSQAPLVSLLNLGNTRGQNLLKRVITGYLERWWQFRVSFSETELGDILLVNEEVDIVRDLIEGCKCDRPLVLMSSARGDPYVISAMDTYERAGGFARIMFKPVGPGALHAVLQLCIEALRGAPRQRGSSSRSSISSLGDITTSPTGERYISRDLVVGASALSRRRSDGVDPALTISPRPALGPRSITYSYLTKDPVPLSAPPASSSIREESPDPDNSSTTISVGSGGLLLKTSVGTLDPGRPVRILVVEDNSILRELLVKWLRSKGYLVSEAADGQKGVEIFKSNMFHVVLLDMSMPVLDGVGAAIAIRQSEQEQQKSSTLSALQPWTTRLIALTGMSSREDKRRAFEAGVDGYLVKPVSFKILYSMFKQLGIT